MRTTKPLSRRLLCLLLAALMALSLAACGNGSSDDDGASDSQDPATSGSVETTTLTADEYIAEIESLNDVSTEVSTATSEALNDLASGDPATMQAGVDKVRAITPYFADFAAIDNPPAEYAEAHAKLSEGCQAFADAMNAFCDDLDALIAGEDVDIETASAEYTNQLAEAGNLITEGLTLVSAVYEG